jgi:hypothetical protein
MMSAANRTRKLIAQHLVDGCPEAGEEIALGIDQTLTQDATGSLGMLALRFDDPAERARIAPGDQDQLLLSGVREALRGGRRLELENRSKGRCFIAAHQLSSRQVDAVLAGNLDKPRAGA